MANESIRERVIRALKAAGMTQRELADAVGSSTQEINAFLRGRQVISFAKLERIFKTLGL